MGSFTIELRYACDAQYFSIEKMNISFFTISIHLLFLRLIGVAFVQIVLGILAVGIVITAAVGVAIAVATAAATAVGIAVDVAVGMARLNSIRNIIVINIVQWSIICCANIIIINMICI